MLVRRKKGGIWDWNTSHGERSHGRTRGRGVTPRPGPRPPTTHRAPQRLRRVLRRKPPPDGRRLGFFCRKARAAFAAPWNTEAAGIAAVANGRRTWLGPPVYSHSSVCCVELGNDQRDRPVLYQGIKPGIIPRDQVLNPVLYLKYSRLETWSQVLF